MGRHRPLRAIFGSLTGAMALAVAAAEVSAQEPAQDAAETVIVTATRLDRDIDDVAATVTVVNAADIAAQIAEDLDDLVRYQPGIGMDTAGRGGNQGFVIRGIGGNRVLTLIDGVRSNDSYDAVVSGYGKDVYETDDIKSLEIIRGPASVYYGADAMGGAVVIRTKDPIDYLTEGESLNIGTRIAGASANDKYKLGFGAAVQGERWGTLAQYTGRDFAESDLANDVELNPVDGRSDGLLLKTVGDVNAANRLTVTLDSVRETTDIDLQSELSGSVFDSQGRDETDRDRISLMHAWQGGNAVTDRLETIVYWQVTDALQHTDQRRTSFSFINPMDPATYGGTQADRATDFEFNQETRGLSLIARKTLSSASFDQEVVYGLSLDVTETERPRNRCDTEVATGSTTCNIAPYPFAVTEDFPNRTFPDTRTTRAGLFVQDELVLGTEGRVTLIPGIRYDDYEMDPEGTQSLEITTFGFEVTPVSEDNVSANLGFLYDIGDALTLAAQYSEGFRPPNFDESNQAFVNRAFGYATVPNPDLRPETSEGIELGLRFHTDRARFSLTVYENDYRDFIASEFIGVADGISLFQDANVDLATISGVELGGNWRISDRFAINGALAQARGTDRRTDAPLDGVDPLTGALGLRFSNPSDRWGIDSILTFVDDKERVSAPDRVTAESYRVVDLIGRFRAGERTVFRAGIYNVFDESYARWANIRGLAAAETEAIARAQAPGTNVRFALAVEF